MEDVIYVGLGTLLAGTAVVLLGFGVVDFVRHATAGLLPETVVALLDRFLLIPMIVEVSTRRRFPSASTSSSPSPSSSSA